MKRINENQFFAQYPEYSNLGELKKADILIMPLHNRKSFVGGQRDFFRLTQDPTINCRFFTEKKDTIPFYAEFSAPPPDLIINFGIAVISTISGLITIYGFLKDITKGKRFSIKHIIAIKGDYYDIEEFEGTIEEYEAVHQEMKSSFEK